MHREQIDIIIQNIIGKMWRTKPQNLKKSANYTGWNQMPIFNEVAIKLHCTSSWSCTMAPRTIEIKIHQSVMSEELRQNFQIPETFGA